MSLFNRKPKQIKIKDLEALVYGNDLDIAERLRDFIANYKQEVENIKNEETKTFNHFLSLGIPKKALLSLVYESPCCNKLVFNQEHSWSKKECWHCVYDYLDTKIQVSYKAKKLLEVLVSIEKESKQKIINFGLSNRCLDGIEFHEGNDFADKNDNIVFGKIKGEVSLDECCDSFNLQLSDGNYYHLFFCESK